MNLFVSTYEIGMIRREREREREREMRCRSKDLRSERNIPDIETTIFVYI